MEHYGEVVCKPTFFIKHHTTEEPIDVVFIVEAHLLLTQGKTYIIEELPENLGGYDLGLLLGYIKRIRIIYGIFSVLFTIIIKKREQENSIQNYTISITIMIYSFNKML